MNLINKYKEIVRSVKMTDTEKNAMRASLIWHIRSNSKPKTFSIYTLPWLRISTAFVFILIVSGSGVAFAAKGALPGDITYPLKIQIEEIKGITKTTPKQKLVYSKKRAETRLSEIKVLMADTNISNEKIAIASKEFENHIQEAKDNANIIAINASEADQKEALIAVKDLEQNIQKDVAVLNALASVGSIDENSISTVVSKNKDTVTEAMLGIALPKKAETDELKNAVSDITIDIDFDIPAGTGEDRSDDEKSDKKPTPLSN